MNLYIKQHVFSWRDRFAIMDESGRDKYTAEGQLFSWGKKLHVYDMSGREVIYIQQKVMSWKPRYHIFVGERQIAELVKEFTFFKPRYTVAGLDWEVEGDFWAHEYVVSRGDCAVVTLSKKWFTWGDSYVLDIPDERNELPALAVMLAIDCAVAQQQSNN